VLATNIFALLLLGLSGLLINSHRCARERVKFASGLEDHARLFANSQYYRRMMASGLIGFLGAAIAIRPLVPIQPLPVTIYLYTLFLACALIIFFAVVDAFATRLYHQRLRGNQRTAQIKLARELKDFQDNLE
jgi:hypothetical protein